MNIQRYFQLFFFYFVPIEAFAIIPNHLDVANANYVVFLTEIASMFDSPGGKPIEKGKCFIYAGSMGKLLKRESYWAHVSTSAIEGWTLSKNIVLATDFKPITRWLEVKTYEVEAGDYGGVYTFYPDGRFSVIEVESNKHNDGYHNVKRKGKLHHCRNIIWAKVDNESIYGHNRIFLNSNEMGFLWHSYIQQCGMRITLVNSKSTMYK